MQPQIYSPGAGHVPAGDSLPGREHIEAAWQNMLADVVLRGRAGARDLVLTGNRGVGKTVAMKRCALIAESQGYVRLAFQASSEATLSGALHEAIAGHPQRHSSWERALEALHRITGVGFGVAGVTASISREQRPVEQPRLDPYNTTAIANALADLARAARHDDGSGGVLICVDELQMSAPKDIEALGGVLNHLNNWHADAPVTFIAAGLPNTLAKMMGDPEHPLISNPTRLFTFEPLDQYLTPEDTTAALRPIARAHGGDWTREAVQELYSATQGYPAHVQVLAAATWTAAPAPTIGVDDVGHATPTAQAEVNRMYLIPRWEQMGLVMRAYITAASMCRAPVESGRIAAMLGRTTNDVSNTRDALIRGGDIYSAGTGLINLAQPLMRNFAPQHYHATVEGAPGLPTLREMSQARDTWVDQRRRPREELAADEIARLATPPPASGHHSLDRHQDPN